MTSKRKTPAKRSSSRAKARPKGESTPRWRFRSLVGELPRSIAAYVRDVERGRQVDRPTLYACDVVAGRILAGPLVRLACARHLRDLPRKDLSWVPEDAAKAIAYFEVVLKLNGEGFEGKPFLLSPHQAFKIGSIYGWLNPDGSRRFRSAYVEEGKGNGKSPEIGGLGVKGLTGDGVPRAEIYFAAPKIEQARIPFRDAVAMVDLSPVLRKHVTKSGRATVSNLAYHRNGSFARPVSNDDRASGPRPYMVLCEELHEHKDPSVVNMLLAGAKGRRNFLIYAVTNSGIFGEPSLCADWREKSINVLQARSPSDDGWDDSWFAYVASLDEGEDPLKDDKCWVKANPNLGVSIQRSYLEQRVTLAKTMPSQEGIVRRVNFCQWIDAVSAWIPLDRWDACTAPVDLAALRGKPCFPSLDLSSRRDFTALVLVFPPIDDRGIFTVLPFLFCPEETIRARVGRDKSVPYELWVRDGHLFATPGDTIDQDFIKAKFLELAELYEFVDCPYDPWNATKLVAELTELGFTMVEFPQNYGNLSPATKDFEEDVLKQKIAHGGHPALRWMFRNVRIRPGPDETVKPDKKGSKERIDGIVAAIAGRARAGVVDPNGKKSIYETQEVMIVG